MKTLCVYQFLTGGGVESVLRARVEGLPAYGITTRAWFLADGEGRELFRGVEGLIDVGGIHDLQRYVERWAPDILMVIDAAEVLGPLAEAPGPMSMVVECHTPYPENRTYLSGKDARRASAYLVPSKYQEAQIAKALPAGAKIHVVPNPIREMFLQTPRAFEPASKNPVVAWIGRLDHLKNWKAFLEIAARVARQGSDVEFWIVGGGSGKGIAQRVYREARARGVIGRLRWFQAPSQEFMPNFLDGIRDSGGVVVSTSRGESFGMAMAEAMARQCAVVVPRLGPFPEFIEDGVTGEFYTPGRAGEAVEKIVKLITNKDRRKSMGLAARARVLASHSPDVALRALADTLRAVASNGHGSLPAGELPK